MDLTDALNKYSKHLKEATFHAHITNGCYDTCGHCYMSAVSPDRAKFVDVDDLVHAIRLLSNGKRRTVGLSGGEPLLHPDVVRLIEEFSGHIEVNTAIFPYLRNENRDEVIDAIAEHAPTILGQRPDEPFHSLTWDHVDEAREYIGSKGLNPDNFGLPNRSAERRQKVYLAMTGIGAVALAIGYLADRYGGSSPQVLPIGRAKMLKDVTFRPHKPNKMFSQDPIMIGYRGQMQLGFYDVHEGFMNISELKHIKNQEDAIELILSRAEDNPAFREMVKRDVWYHGL